MNTTQFTFDSEQLNRLFPYYILLNKDFSIKDCGTLLKKIVSFSGQSYFTDFFKIIGHFNDSENKLQFKENAGYKVKLSLIHQPEIYLEGSLEYLKHIEKYLFTGNIATNPEYNKDIPVSDELNLTKPSYTLNFYEQVLDELPADIAVFDTRHTYQFLNVSAIKDPELRKWMIGKTDEDYCKFRNKPMSIAMERREHFNEVMQTKKLKTWEEKSISQDGSVSYLLRNFYPVLDTQNNVEFVIGYGIDITDRKNIEDQLKINEKRYRDLYNFCPALIFTHDTVGTILSVNPAIHTILGYNTEDVISKNMTSLLSPSDRKKVQSEYLNKVNSAGESKGVFRINHKNGTIKYLLYQNYKVEENDAAPYIIGFSQDITERLKAEKELLLAKHTTENMARVKDTFLSNMSHEIRTPMSGILGITQLLVKTNLDKEQSNYANLIADSVKNLLTIINDILDMEKISSGKIEFEDNPFKVVDKVKSVIQSFQHKAEIKNLELILDNTLPANLVIIGDQYRLAQILTNLLNNALKFTISGSITIGLSLIHYSDTNVIIEFTVQDTGIGISKNQIGYIFDPFVKAISNLDSKFGGTGLGLSICKSLIEMQGGNIKISSDYNKGTALIFNLPYKRGSLQMINNLHDVVIKFEKINKKILVAEDIELNQFLIKTMLESWGCTVDIAENGIEAIKKLIKAEYDLILMDIRMPEMDGLIATKLIRELPQPDKANIPIIAITANALQGDGKIYLKSGMNDYIFKPYAEEKLYEKITKVLNISATTSDDPNFENDKQNSNILMPQEQENIITQPSKLYDVTMLKSISNNNQAFVEKMIKMFADIVTADFNKIKEAGAKNNREDVKEVAHKLKSTFGNMGTTTLLPYAVELEKGTAEMLPVINNMSDELDRVLAQIKIDFAHLF